MVGYTVLQLNNSIARQKAKQHYASCNFRTSRNCRATIVAFSTTKKLLLKTQAARR